MRTLRLQFSGGGHGSSHGIDLAPMLDFVINLLIFFIITAVFVKEAGLAVSRPTGIEEGQTSINIQILENGTVVFGDRTVDLRAVRANIERIRAVSSSAMTSVLINAQERAPTGIVVAVVDEVHLGGIEDITFSTTP